MTPEQAVELGREAIMLSLLIGAPVLIAGMLMGMVIGLLQALTQVQDQTVSFVPKIVVMVLVLAFCLPWLLQRLMDYSHNLILDIPRMIAGG